jgi:outer membrane lipoprotein-sorting protein
MCRLLNLLVAVLVLAPSAARAQTPTVDQIVAKNLAAKGGEEALRSATTMKMSGTLTVQGMQAPVKVLTKRPNLMLQEMTMNGARIVSAFDGQRVWGINPMLGGNQPREVTGVQSEAVKDRSTFDGPLVGYKGRGDTLELVGSATVGDADTWKLKLTRQNGRTMFIYVDKNTGLEREWATTVDQAGMTLDIQTLMSDYQPADNGVQVARTLRTLIGGHEQAVLKVESVEFNVPIEDSVFKMP